VTEYVTARPEVTHIAFEFATERLGASDAVHLANLADWLKKVERPLHLVVRAGLSSFRAHKDFPTSHC